MTITMTTKIALLLLCATAGSNALSLEEHLALVPNTPQNLRTQPWEIPQLAVPSYVRISLYSDNMCTSPKMNRASTQQLDTCVPSASSSSSLKITLTPDSSTSYDLYFYSDSTCISGSKVASVPIVADCVFNTVFGAYIKMEITSTPTIVYSNEGIFYR